MNGKEEQLEENPKLNLETFKSNVESTVELIREGFLQAGTRFGLGELAESPSIDMLSPQVDNPDPWVFAGDKEKKDYLRNVIIILGLTPDQLTRERAITIYEDPGVKGELSEGGADVWFIKHNIPGLNSMS